MEEAGLRVWVTIAHFLSDGDAIQMRLVCVKLRQLFIPIALLGCPEFTPVVQAMATGPCSPCHCGRFVPLDALGTVVLVGRTALHHVLYRIMFARHRFGQAPSLLGQAIARVYPVPHQTMHEVLWVISQLPPYSVLILFPADCRPLKATRATSMATIGLPSPVWDILAGRMPCGPLCQCNTRRYESMPRLSRICTPHAAVIFTSDPRIKWRWAQIEYGRVLASPPPHTTTATTAAPLPPLPIPVPSCADQVDLEALFCFMADFPQHGPFLGSLILQDANASACYGNPFQPLLHIVIVPQCLLHAAHTLLCPGGRDCRGTCSTTLPWGLPGTAAHATRDLQGSCAAMQAA
eukprot:gene3967-4327_t